MPTNLRFPSLSPHGPANADSLMAALNALVLPAAACLFFHVQESQYPNYNALSSPAPTQSPSIDDAEAPRSSTWHDVLPTPVHVREQLGLQQIALWQLAGLPVWAVSTQSHTVLLGAPETLPVEWVNVLPAKGGGNKRLYIGKLALYDAYHSGTLLALALAIEQQTGLRIKKSESHDC